ncbi:hypothetical protein MCEMSEM23_02980 [Rhabdaerophilaceae bacterium]
MTRLRLFAAFFLALVAFPQIAQAQSVSMTWKFKAFHENIVDIQLYSQNRNNVWPGTTRVWSIKNFETQTMKISCIAGERICHGAWVRGTSSMTWGVGQNNKQRCANCCYTCADNVSTPVINLNTR